MYFFPVDSFGEVCSHVAGLLFKIPHTAVMLGHTKRSTTSETAYQWNGNLDRM